MTDNRRALNLHAPDAHDTVGIMFVGDGTPYDPAGERPALTDEEYAAWVLYKYGQADADLLTELYKAIAGRDGWRRHNGYTQHAINRRDGHTSIVMRFPDDTGWRWQVWRAGTHKPARPIQGPPAATAEEAVRLADEFVDKAARRRRGGATA